MWIRDFFGKRMNSRRGSTRSRGGARPGLSTLRLRLEPLEERTLLSVGPADDFLFPGPDPDQLIDAANTGALGPAIEPPVQGDGAPALANHDAKDKEPWLAIMGWDLIQLYREYDAFIQGGGQVEEFTPSNTSLRLHGHGVVVGVVTIEPLRGDR